MLKPDATEPWHCSSGNMSTASDSASCKHAPNSVPSGQVTYPRDTEMYSQVGNRTLLDVEVI